jgi:hypothetical protein
MGASNLHDAKAVNPEVLQSLKDSSAIGNDIAARESSERASRGDARGAQTLTTLSEDELQAQAWMLPLNEYQYTSTWPPPRARSTRRSTRAR